MKLIRNFHYVEEAEQIAEQLRQQGIVTHISSKGLHGYFKVAIKVGLWAVLDEQYEDALKFIADPAHTITSGLTPDQIEMLQQEASGSTFEMKNNAILYGVILIIALIVLLMTLGEIG